MPVSASLKARRAHHEVNVGAAQFAGKTSEAIASLVKMQGRIGVAVRVIFWTETPDSPVADA
jgi:hypothetical protein